MTEQEFLKKYDDRDKAEKEAALKSAPVYKLAEPILSNKELSEVVGSLTARIESLRSDLVSLERRYVEIDSKPRTSLAEWVEKQIVSFAQKVLEREIRKATVPR